MKPKLLLSLGFLSCLGLQAVLANDIEPSRDQYNALPNSIVADGDLSDWGAATVWRDSKFYIPKGSGDTGTLVSFEELGGTWTGPDDHTTAFAVVWDSENLYIGVVVTDDYHENAATAPGSAWNGDSLQLAFANATRDTITHLYNYCLAGNDDAGLTDVFVHDEQGPPSLTVQGIRRDTANHTTFYEIKFPAAVFGFPQFEAGMQFGVGLCINDGDLDAPGQKGWSGWGVHSIVFGKTAAETGLVTLQGTPPPRLEYTAEPANYITVDGSLEDWPGKEFKGPTPFEIPKAGGGTLVYFEELGGTWSGPEDHTSLISIAWSADALYIGVVVTDDYHENAATAPGSAWNGDSLQVAFANAARDTITGLYNYCLPGNDDAGLTDVFIHDEQGPPGLTEAAIRRDTANHKTFYEIKFPAAVFGLDQFQEGTQLGIGLCINDGDLDAPGQKGWSGFGVHSIVFGKSPDRTGLVTLGPAKAPPILEFTARPAGFITPDGSIADWEGQAFIGPVPFEIPKAGGGTVVLFEELGGTWTGPDDHTSIISVAWERDALYLGVVVTDDYHENAATAAGSAWNGDSLQVAFATAARDAMTGLYNYCLAGTDDAGLTDVFIHDEQGPPSLTVPGIRRDPASHMTVYEVKVPVAVFGLSEFTEGQQLGVGLCINDGDLDSPGQKGWSGFGVHSIVFGKSPDRTGLITLAGTGPPRPRLTASLTAANLIINFTAGTLERSDKPFGGTWTEVATSSPATIPRTQAPGFYRAVVH